MSGPALRRVLYVGVVLFLILHNDLWLWDNPRFVAGLPIGLTYHVGFCLAVAGLMALIVRSEVRPPDAGDDGSTS